MSSNPRAWRVNEVSGKEGKYTDNHNEKRVSSADVELVRRGLSKKK
jgi:hypothetical protein